MVNKRILSRHEMEVPSVASEPAQSTTPSLRPASSISSGPAASSTYSSNSRSYKTSDRPRSGISNNVYVKPVSISSICRTFSDSSEEGFGHGRSGAVTTVKLLISPPKLRRSKPQLEELPPHSILKVKAEDSVAISNKGRLPSINRSQTSLSSDPRYRNIPRNKYCGRRQPRFHIRPHTTSYRPATITNLSYTTSPEWLQFISFVETLEREYDTLEGRNANQSIVKKLLGDNGVLDLPASIQFLNVMKEVKELMKRKRRMMRKFPNAAAFYDKNHRDTVDGEGSHKKFTDAKNKNGLDFHDEHSLLSKSSDSLLVKNLEKRNFDASDSESCSSSMNHIALETAEQKHRQAVIQAAQRGWMKLRIKVREMGFQKRAEDLTRINWIFLKQAISNMANTSRARRELYDQYLLYPDEWIAELNMSYLPESFLRLHQHFVWRRAVRRPLTTVALVQRKHRMNKLDQEEERLNRRMAFINRPKTTSF